jgi:hypothetical protein
MKQVSIRFKEVPDNNYPWSSIEELDELAGVYYRLTVLFPGKKDFEKIFDVVYPHKLESFLQRYSNLIDESYYNDEGFELPDRNKAQKIDVKMDDLEDIESGLKTAIDKLAN